eukprot:scaffold15035_cov72-Phaeocystis_antarctica.AAC.1
MRVPRAKATAQQPIVAVPSAGPLAIYNAKSVAIGADVRLRMLLLDQARPASIVLGFSLRWHSLLASLLEQRGLLHKAADRRQQTSRRRWRRLEP